MIQATINTGTKPEGLVKGTYIYALYQKKEVVHVGQCTDMQAHIDELATTGRISFDRFSYTFLDGVEPFSDVSNLMELVAINRLMPSFPKKQTTPEKKTFPVFQGKLIYRLKEEKPVFHGKAPSKLPWKKMLHPGGKKKPFQWPGK